MQHQPPAVPTNSIAHRVAAGASVHDMMRRGELAGQALALLQMVAASTASPGTHPARDRLRPHPPEAN